MSTQTYFYWEDVPLGSVVLPDEPLPGRTCEVPGLLSDVPEPELPPMLLSELPPELLPGDGVEGVTPWLSDVPSVVLPEVPPDGDDGVVPGVLCGLVEGAAPGEDDGGGMVWVESGELVAPPDWSLPPLPPPRLHPPNPRESRPTSNTIFET